MPEHCNIILSHENEVSVWYKDNVLEHNYSGSFKWILQQIQTDANDLLSM